MLVVRTMKDTQTGGGIWNPTLYSKSGNIENLDFLKIGFQLVLTKNFRDIFKE